MFYTLLTYVCVMDFKGLNLSNLQNYKFCKYAKDFHHAMIVCIDEDVQFYQISFIFFDWLHLN